MRYSEIMKICDANRVKYDKGIKKLDECNFPNDSCYSLAQEISVTLDKALHVGFQRGFHHVSDVIGALTEIAAVLPSGRAVKFLPVHNTTVKKFKKQIELLHENVMKEESMMKDTVKQYIDNSLDAITYLKKKSERTGLDLAPLNSSEKLLKEMDAMLKNVFDDKSEEAVTKVTKICNAVRAWRDVASSGMVTHDVVKYLQTAVNETREWTTMYNKKKEAKTPAPVYQDDLLSSYAAYEKHLGAYDMFHKVLEGKRQDIEQQKEALRMRQAKLDEIQAKIDSLSAEKGNVEKEIKMMLRDKSNGDITESEFMSKAKKFKAKMEEIDKLIAREKQTYKIRSAPQANTDSIADLIEHFDTIVENAEWYKTDEPVFVEISKEMDFVAMTRFLQGTASPVEKQKVRDTRLNMNVIIDYVNQMRKNTLAEINLDIDEEIKAAEAVELANEQKNAQEAEKEKDALNDWLSNFGFSGSEEEEEEEQVGEKNDQRRMSLDDIF